MKILTYEEAKLNKTVVALGKFEGLHSGHMLLIHKVLEVAACNNLSSTVCTIEFSERKQLNTNVERYHILDNQGIEYLVRCAFTSEFAGLSPEEFFKKILIDRLDARSVVVGTDFRFGYNREGDIHTLMALGKRYDVDIIVLEKISIDDNIISTSVIRKFIEVGNIEKANCFLGRPYFVMGKVVKGKQLGRTIGFPTANIIPEHDKLLPAFGVYETRVIIDGKTYKALTNVGNNPTVQDGKNIVVETNIIGFSSDIYDRIIKVEFLRYIRKEQKFSSLDELVIQMKKDKASVI